MPILVLAEPGVGFFERNETKPAERTSLRRDCGHTIETETPVCPECGGRKYETFLLK